MIFTSFSSIDTIDKISDIVEYVVFDKIGKISNNDRIDKNDKIVELGSGFLWGRLPTLQFYQLYLFQPCGRLESLKKPAKCPGKIVGFPNSIPTLSFPALWTIRIAKKARKTVPTLSPHPVEERERRPYTVNTTIN